MLSVILLSAAFFCCYLEYNYAECGYAEGHYAECRGIMTHEYNLGLNKMEGLYYKDFTAGKYRCNYRKLACSNICSQG